MIARVLEEIAGGTLAIFVVGCVIRFGWRLMRAAERDLDRQEDRAEETKLHTERR